MKSVRLDPELEARLARAADMEGVSESSFIREALRRRCDEVLARTLAEDLAELGVIGAVALGGEYATQTGRRFAELLDERQRSKA